MPLVSVIMPVFNGERFIRASISSVLGQTWKDLELIVVNDGSTDRTLEIIESIAGDEARLKVITQANSGSPAKARNRGLVAVSGRYVSFLDADDYYLPHRVAALVEGLERNSGWVAAFHDLRYVEADGKEIPGSYLLEAGFLKMARDHMRNIGGDWWECGKRFYVFQSLFYGVLHTQSVMIATDRIPNGTLWFDEQFVVCEDTDLWIRMGMCGAIGYLDQILSCYRLHDRNITGNKLRFVRDSVALHVLNYDRIVKGLTENESQIYRRKVARYLHELGYAELLASRVREARVAYRSAIKWDPTLRYVRSYLKSLLPRGVWQWARPMTRD